MYIWNEVSVVFLFQLVSTILVLPNAIKSIETISAHTLFYQPVTCSCNVDLEHDPFARQPSRAFDYCSNIFSITMLYRFWIFATPESGASIKRFQFIYKH